MSTVIFVVKIGVDTAENGLSKNRLKDRRKRVLGDLQVLAGVNEEVATKRVGVHEAPHVNLGLSAGHDTSLFPRLVLGCINADFGHQIL